VTIEGLASPAQSVLIDGFGSGIFTDTQGTGAGGNILVNANNVTLRNGGALSATTSGSEPSATGGTIQVAANQMEVSGGSTITTQTFGPGSAGQIFVTGDSVYLNAGQVFADTFGDGNAGSIDMQTGIITLEGFSVIGSSAFSGSGNAGSIQVRATESLSLTDSAILSGSFSESPTAGNSGQIFIASPTINLDASTLSTSAIGHGNAGAIRIDTNSLTIANAGAITSSTAGEGQGGTITASGYGGEGTSAERISLSNAAEILTESTNANPVIPGLGQAGSITLTASDLSLANNSRISAETRFSQGNAGNITVDANQLTIASNSEISSRSIEGVDPAFQYGNAGTINLRASNATVTNGGFISTSTESNGNAGGIVLNAGTLNISDGGFITSSSTIGTAGIIPSGSAGNVTIEGLTSPAQSVLIDGTGSGISTDTQGTGAGGNIFINANSVTLQNGGKLSAATSGTAASTTGGTITVNGNQVQLTSGALITASTTGAGAGGSVNINAASTFASNAGTVTSSASQATGGDINITTGGSVTLDNGSLVTASSNGVGNAGNIVINAGQQYTSTNSSVSTKAEQASGGNITVLAAGLVHLTNSELNASVEGSSTTVGGNILIDPLYVILENSQILAQATQGQGGNINIFYSGAFLVDPSSVISASSQFGQSGTVTIQSPISPASGKIIPIGQKPLIATSLFSQRCTALAAGSFSSFTVAGRDSLPAEPGGWLSSPLPLAVSENEEGTVREADGTMSDGTPLLSVRNIGPPGFLTQAFAGNSLVDCGS
jgi:large exoprotein involved in heme utilization and adhesion